MSTIVADWIEQSFTMVEIPSKVIEITLESFGVARQLADLPTEVLKLFELNHWRGPREEWAHLPEGVQRELELLPQFYDPDNGVKITEGGKNESGGQTDNKVRWHFRDDTLGLLEEHVLRLVVECARCMMGHSVGMPLSQRFPLADAAQYYIEHEREAEDPVVRRAILSRIPGMWLVQRLAALDQEAHDAMVPVVWPLLKELDASGIFPSGFSMVRRIENDSTLFNRRTLVYRGGRNGLSGVMHDDHGFGTVPILEDCGNLRYLDRNGNLTSFERPEGMAPFFVARHTALLTGAQHSPDRRMVVGGTLPSLYHAGEATAAEMNANGGVRCARILFIDPDHVVPWRNRESPTVQILRERGLPLPPGF